MRDEWEKPLPEQGCIRMVEGVLGIEIQTEIQDNTGEGNTREKTLYLYVLCWEEKYRRKY